MAVMDNSIMSRNTFGEFVGRRRPSWVSRETSTRTAPGGAGGSSGGGRDDARSRSSISIMNSNIALMCSIRPIAWRRASGVSAKCVSSWVFASPVSCT